MPKYLLIITLIICSLAISELTMADVPPEQVKEVNHLLAFVKNSGCIINRNGSDHPAEKSVNHIEMK